MVSIFIFDGVSLHDIKDVLHVLPLSSFLFWSKTNRWKHQSPRMSRIVLHILRFQLHCFQGCALVIVVSATGPPGRHVGKTRIEWMHMQLPVRGRCIAFGGMAHSVDVLVHFRVGTNGLGRYSDAYQRLDVQEGCRNKIRWQLKYPNVHIW